MPDTDLLTDFARLIALGTPPPRDPDIVDLSDFGLTLRPEWAREPDPGDPSVGDRGGVIVTLLGGTLTGPDGPTWVDATVATAMLGRAWVEELRERQAEMPVPKGARAFAADAEGWS